MQHICVNIIGFIELIQPQMLALWYPYSLYASFRIRHMYKYPSATFQNKLIIKNRVKTLKDQ